MQSRYAKNPSVSHTCIYKKSRCTASLWRCTLMYNFNKKQLFYCKTPKAWFAVALVGSISFTFSK